MMTRRTFQAGIVFAASGPGTAWGDSPTVPGTWSGVLEAGRRLRLKLDLGSDGTTSLFSLDQGGQLIPGHVTASNADH